MIPVTLPRNKAKFARGTFTCFHCGGEFYKRGGPGKRLFCVDCQDRASRQKENAHERLYKRIKAGEIEPPNKFACVDCGSPSDRYDHRDYALVYDVVPVCCRCNLKRGPAKLDPNL